MITELHCHTTASDGTLSPAELIERALAQGVELLAITDHDTTDAIEPALQAARGRLELWPAIEMNCSEPGPYEVHVLGYWIDPTHSGLQAVLARIRTAREGRIAEMVERLQSLGLELGMEDVRAFARGPSMGRPHLARALVARGLAADVNQAFDRYLAQGQPAYVPRYSLRPQEAIEVITAAGGLPVLAHPGLIGTDEFLAGYVQGGLRGLEVYYPAHSSEQIAHLEALARRHGLLTTGGSDFHGPGGSAELGQMRLPESALLALREARVG